MRFGSRIGIETDGNPGGIYPTSWTPLDSQFNRYAAIMPIIKSRRTAGIFLNRDSSMNMITIAIIEKARTRRFV